MRTSNWVHHLQVYRGEHQKIFELPPASSDSLSVLANSGKQLGLYFNRRSLKSKSTEKRPQSLDNHRSDYDTQKPWRTSFNKRGFFVAGRVDSNQGKPIVFGDVFWILSKNFTGVQHAKLTWNLENHPFERKIHEKILYTSTSSKSPVSASMPVFWGCI